MARSCRSSPRGESGRSRILRYLHGETCELTAADSNGKTLIGNQWSSAWLPVGFLNNSLSIPLTIAERQVLLESIANYLQANPDKQNGPLVFMIATGPGYLAAGANIFENRIAPLRSRRLTVRFPIRASINTSPKNCIPARGERSGWLP